MALPAPVSERRRRSRIRQSDVRGFWLEPGALAQSTRAVRDWPRLGRHGDRKLGRAPADLAPTLVAWPALGPVPNGRLGAGSNPGGHTAPLDRFLAQCLRHERSVCVARTVALTAPRVFGAGRAAPYPRLDHRYRVVGRASEHPICRE